MQTAIGWQKIVIVLKSPLGQINYLCEIGISLLGNSP